MTCAILTRNLRYAIEDLRQDYSAKFNDMRNGIFPDGEWFRIYTDPERLYGAKISQFIVLAHKNYSVRDYRELDEMQAIAERRVQFK